MYKYFSKMKVCYAVRNEHIKMPVKNILQINQMKGKKIIFKLYLFDLVISQ